MSSFKAGYGIPKASHVCPRVVAEDYTGGSDGTTAVMYIRPVGVLINVCFKQEKWQTDESGKSVIINNINWKSLGGEKRCKVHNPQTPPEDSLHSYRLNVV